MHIKAGGCVEWVSDFRFLSVLIPDDLTLDVNTAELVQ